MYHISVVEDDNSIRDLVLYALRSGGYEARGFENGAEFFASLSTACPDLVLLDIMLPDMDGLSILQQIRSSSSGNHVLVMMLTAKGSEFDKVNALDLGADDYMTKPFGVMELLSRINALLRRANLTDREQPLVCGAIQLDPVRRSVSVRGKEVSLTFKEFELLRYLLEHADAVLTREKMLQTVWGYNFEGESRTVDMHIKLLRQKLGVAGEQIRTVRGMGYKLIAGGEEQP